MRKRLITPSSQDTSAHDEGWLHLDCLAVVEVTSEDKDYPVESALAAEEVRVGGPPILAVRPSG